MQPISIRGIQISIATDVGKGSKCRKTKRQLSGKRKNMQLGPTSQAKGLSERSCLKTLSGSRSRRSRLRRAWQFWLATPPSQDHT